VRERVELLSVRVRDATMLRPLEVHATVYAWPEGVGALPLPEGGGAVMSAAADVASNAVGPPVSPPCHAREAKEPFAQRGRSTDPGVAAIAHSNVPQRMLRAWTTALSSTLATARRRRRCEPSLTLLAIADFRRMMI
jgi:hypothetical protein